MLVKNSFSIKDIENLTGIKAHTIRIWEKRYSIIEPTRSSTNIRSYNLSHLKKLLNISYLSNEGIKISVIAELSDEELSNQVLLYVDKYGNNQYVIAQLKIAMMNYDHKSFLNVYTKKVSEIGFEEFYTSILTPFLIELGYLWQSNTVNITHEHFVSHLIKLKINSEISDLQLNDIVHTNEFYILYLPEGELHDIGISFLNYELLRRGCNVLYLGPSVPMESLIEFTHPEKHVHFVCHMTVFPHDSDLESYLHSFKEKVMASHPGKNSLHVLGRKSALILEHQLQNDQFKYNSIEEFIANLPELIYI